MRGKGIVKADVSDTGGITPAHAGKRQEERIVGVLRGDHPRPCGEKAFMAASLPPGQGSPPPMRGKVIFVPLSVIFPGITPAHAGKSTGQFLKFVLHQDHPRPCGEKWTSCVRTLPALGSPPPMRGKVWRTSEDGSRAGITPAHAGKRCNIELRTDGAKDHPRPCGEKGRQRHDNRRGEGSPPPMRGKVANASYIEADVGITPAHAGKSLGGQQQ